MHICKPDRKGIKTGDVTEIEIVLSEHQDRK